MRVAAAVPFKRFSRAKGRLRARYTDGQVEQIGRAMLQDVLAALGAAPGVERVVVLTDDAEVASLAHENGAAVRLEDPDPGLNAAIDGAARELAEEGYEAMLVVLGDLPLLTARDVERVLETGRHAPVVVVPSADGGTAMLFRRPPLRIPARFGEGSAAAHLEAARGSGLDPGPVSEVDALARLDLDTPEDAERVLASGVPCRTREVLRRIEA